MSANIEIKQSSIEVKKVQNGIDSELFGYLHPSPDCVTEQVTDSASGKIYLVCNTHKVRSGEVILGYITR